MDLEQVTEVEIDFIAELQKVMYRLKDIEGDDFFMIFLFKYSGKYSSKIFDHAMEKF